MKIYKGKVAASGYAYGNIVEVTHKNTFISKKKITDIEVEKTKLNVALERSIKQLDKLYNKVLLEVNEENAEIFLMHKMLLSDPDYKGRVINIIKNNNYRAEYAVDIIGKEFANNFESLEDEYLRGRAADFRDITKRMIKNILGNKQVTTSMSKNSIVLADDLDPSETIHLDKKKVIAFVTRNGSVNSHTAILARTMNIPAIVSVDVPYGISGKAIVDKKGNFIVNPNKEKLDEYNEISSKYFEKISLLQQLKGKEVKTKSNKKINLKANIGSVDDVEYAIENDADGIGLFRTEFLYLESKDFPTEQQQFDEYKKVIEKINKEVTIRTLDFGADKQADYFDLSQEENPALGYRAIRICLSETELFKTQLRAIYKASTYGDVKLMFPMIISEWEIIKIKEIISDVKKELDTEGVLYKNIPIGITIETPAAVMICDELAKHVEFFSIGTNDLAQYTLAIDRQNQKLEKFYDPHHPAILKMIKIVAECAKKNNIKVGICGEIGADKSLTKTFVEMGIDELSVAPSSILPIKKIILDME